MNQSYDEWKATNPADEWLGPEPRDQEAEDDYWRMIEEERQPAKTLAIQILYEAELRKLL